MNTPKHGVKNLMRNLLLLLLTTAALAQEFWLQPVSFRVATGALVPLRLLVGQSFVGKAWARPTRRVARFMRYGPSGPADSTDLRPALLADSLDPVLRCPAPGTHLLALTSQLAFSELPADLFTAYLREQGLGYTLRQRQEAGVAATKPGREAYRRCAKSLLLATTGPRLPSASADTTYRRVLGLPLELVPEQNPYRLRPGAGLTVRVLRQGQPVPGALVHVWQMELAAEVKQNHPPTVVHFTTYTNAQGRLLLRLPGAGPYLLATVRIENAPPTLAARADWLSTWASLSFGGPETATNSR